MNRADEVKLIIEPFIRHFWVDEDNWYSCPKPPMVVQMKVREQNVIAAEIKKSVKLFLPSSPTKKRG